MNNVQAFYTQSQLSLAAYATLISGIPDLKSLEGAGMSQSQAEQFASEWQVVEQFNGTFGLSATVFRNVKDNTFHLAIRGTAGFKALATDALLALGISDNLNAQWLSLKDKLTNDWLAEGGILEGGATVSGHSLGGYLAAAVKQEFGATIGKTYLYNAPGTGGIVGTLGSLLTGLFSQSTPGSNNIWNLKASEGPSIIAGLGGQPSGSLPIQIEESGALGNHSIVTITDALALQTLYAHISPNLTPADLNKLVDATGSEMNRTLEDALDALRQIAQGSALSKADQTKTNREAFYKNLYALQKDPNFLSWKDTDRLKLSLTKATIDSDAKVDSDTGLATRYALAMLNPFTLTGVDYSGFNAEGQLDRYDPATGKGMMTDKYLEDRSNFLERKVWFSTEDKPSVKSQLDEKDTHVFQQEHSYYIDETSGYKILQGGLHNNTHVYAFGGDGKDTLIGQALEDHLYGGAGNDTLNGKAGDDYLQGDTGKDDKYIFSTGDGTDTIVDKDGGIITRDNSALAKGSRVSGKDNEWENATAKIRYTKEADGTTLKIEFTDGSNDTIYIKNFDFTTALNPDLPSSARQASFGIELTPKPQGALTVGTNQKNNPTHNLSPIGTVSTSLKEGNQTVFTYFISEAAAVVRNLALTLAGGNLSQLALSTGTDQHSFAGGTVTLTLAAGQTSLTFSLTNTGDTDADANLTLKATVSNPANTNDVPIVSNTAAIAYQSRIEANTNTNTTVTITDSSGGKRITPQGIDSLVTAPSYPGTALTKIQGGSGNDLIIGSNSGDQLFGDDGNDWIRGGTVNVNTGEQRLSGGQGNDWITSNGVGGQINGDEGDDILGQAPIKIMASPQDARTGGEPQWDNADIYWQAISQGITPTATAATLTQQGNTHDLSGGSWQTRPDGSRYLQPDFNINTSSGSFTAGDGTEYTYTYLANTPFDGTLSLSFNGGLTTKTINLYTDTDNLNTDTQAVKLDGGEGSDALLAGSLGDVLIGGAGNDLIQGGAGNDSAYGDGSPYNTLNQSGAGNDQMALGAGDDYADGGDGDDFIIGEDGADALFGGRGNDVLQGGRWAPTSVDQGAGDYLDGEDGDDTLYGSTGNDTLIGGKGNDTLQGDVWGGTGSPVCGDDYLNGGDGADTLIGSGGKDTLYGGADNDLLSGDGLGVPEAQHGDDTLYGEGGDDTLYGEGGKDKLFGGEGDDAILAGKGDDTLDGGDGTDTLWGNEGDDLLAGGLDQDNLFGGEGDDLYLFELGDSEVKDGIYDTLNDTEGKNVVRFGSGISVDDVSLQVDNSQRYLVVQYSGTDAFLIEFGMGGAVSSFEFADGSRYSTSELIGRNSDTPLRGSDLNGSVATMGGTQNDTITSNQANATLSGGKGNDTLTGGGGNNTYLYSQGDGTDLIIDDSRTQGNKIKFGEGIRAEDIKLGYVANSLNLQVGQTVGDVVEISGFQPFNAQTIANVDLFEFDDGTILTSAELLERGLDIEGTAGDDVLQGSYFSDRMTGGAGNDVLIGGEGDDTYLLNLGDGRDRISSISGRDRLSFGEGILPGDIKLSVVREINGQPSLLLEYGSGDSVVIIDGVNGSIDTFEFANGDVLDYATLFDTAQKPSFNLLGTYAADVMDGGFSDDVLAGGDGADDLAGWDGNDNLLGGTGLNHLAGGLGNDTYTVSMGATDIIDDRLGSTIETIRLDDGMKLADFRAVRIDNDLVMKHLLDSTSIAINGFFELQPENKSWVITDDVALPRNVADWYAEIAGTSTVKSRLLDGFNAIQIADIRRRGLAGETLGSLQNLSKKGAQYVEYLYTYPYWRHYDLNYKFAGVTQQTVTMLSPNLTLGSSESESVAFTTASVVRQVTVPVYQTTWVAGRQYTIPPIGGGVAYPFGSAITFLQNGFMLVTEPAHYVQTYVGTKQVTYQLEMNTAEVERAFKVFDVQGTADNDVINLDLSDPPFWGYPSFRGSVASGDGDDLISLGTHSKDTQEWWTWPEDGRSGMGTTAFGVGALLDGGAGNDRLIGTDANDLLLGGAGSDFLDGGRGADTYYLDFAADDFDVVYDSGTPGQPGIGYGGIYPMDTVVFGEGISAQNLQWRMTENAAFDDYQVMEIIQGTSKVLMAFDDPLMPDKTQAALGVEWFKFADEAALSRQAFMAQVTRLPDNHAPVLGLAIEEQTIYGQKAFSFALPTDSLFDIDMGDVLSYSAMLENGDPLPTWLRFDAATQTFSGIANNDQVGVLSVKVIATDLSHSATSSVFSLNIALGNSAPTVAVPLADQMATEDDVFNFTLPAGTFFDPDGDTLTYSVTLVDGSPLPVWINVNSNTGAMSGTFSNTSAGIYGIRVTAKDPDGLTASDDFILDIANHLLGTSSANTLTSTSFRDVMEGLAGNDTYVINSTLDTIIEAANGGTDTVQSSIDYTLGNNLENLTLTGSANLNGTGNAANNTITGNSGNNILDGGLGADTLIGGTGNDTFIVDNTGDVVTESSSTGGTDTIQSSVTYTLSTNVENLTLTGNANINGTGNSSNNTLIGNSGNNTLNGGSGADNMAGGLGDDLYIIDNAGDIITEQAGEGRDTVQTSLSYTLGANVENLTLTGSNNRTGTGNGLDNILIGNSANNTLTGGAGNDTLDGGSGTDKLIGGTGNDLYIINSTTDTLTELVGEGTDTVQSSVTYTLGANLENLTLTGSSNINGTGNTLDNVLTGNIGNNTLTGSTGNDTLNGGAGTDTLNGGAGNDTYVLGRGHGSDTITDTDATVGNTDVASFLSGIATDQLWFRHVGNNLEVSVIGTTDKFSIQNWYSGSNNHVEQFRTADGHLLLDTQVENLVTAMAAFAPPAAGQTTLPPAYQTALAPVLAANWQ